MRALVKDIHALAHVKVSDRLLGIPVDAGEDPLGGGGGEGEVREKTYVQLLSYTRWKVLKMCETMRSRLRGAGGTYVCGSLVTMRLTPSGS